MGFAHDSPRIMLAVIRMPAIRVSNTKGLPCPLRDQKKCLKQYLMSVQGLGGGGQVLALFLEPKGASLSSRLPPGKPQLHPNFHPHRQIVAASWGTGGGVRGWYWGGMLAPNTRKAYIVSLFFGK